jgi:hypothetical protein
VEGVVDVSLGLAVGCHVTGCSTRIVGGGVVKVWLWV